MFVRAVRQLLKRRIWVVNKLNFDSDFKTTRCTSELIHKIYTPENQRYWLELILVRYFLI